MQRGGVWRVVNGGNVITEAQAGQVALLVDFENLVRSVDEEDIDCEAVFQLADEYGRVLVANANADWRMKGREPVSDGPVRARHRTGPCARSAARRVDQERGGRENGCRRGQPDVLAFAHRRLCHRVRRPARVPCFDRHCAPKHPSPTKRTLRSAHGVWSATWRDHQLVVTGWSNSVSGRMRVEQSLLAESWNPRYQRLGFDPDSEDPSFLNPAVAELAKSDGQSGS